MWNLGTGNTPEMYQGLPVTTEPTIQFQMASHHTVCSDGRNKYSSSSWQ